MRLLSRALLSTSVLIVLVNSQACPKQSGRQGPPASKPKNCPEWSAVPPVKGTSRDNECLVAGIMGVSQEFLDENCSHVDVQHRVTSGTHVTHQTWAVP
jgi:hypothetical protein